MAAFLLGYPLAYVMAFRAGRLKNLLLGLVILPFFTTFLVRTFAWKTILGDGGMAVSSLSFLHLLPEEGRLLNTSWAVVGGPHVQLPALHDPPDLREPGEDRPAVGEAAQDLYSSPRARVSLASSFRSPSPGYSPEASSPSSRPPATSSTPSCWAAPTSVCSGRLFKANS